MDRALGSLAHWTLGLLDPWTLGPVDSWPLGLLDFWTLGPWTCGPKWAGRSRQARVDRALGPMDSWTLGSGIVVLRTLIKDRHCPLGDGNTVNPREGRKHHPDLKLSRI